jgi:hypothetical protein
VPQLGCNQGLVSRIAEAEWSKNAPDDQTNAQSSPKLDLSGFSEFDLLWDQYSAVRGNRARVFAGVDDVGQ